MNNHPIFDKIKQDIETNDVVLFMKGTANAPLCGFSSVVVQILQKLSVDFKDINVLEDNELREAIKIYSDWPTIPQLYIKGEFIGGCDIVREMFASGELQELLKEKNIKIAG
ncbi:MAG: monothiol glutaredoxin [Rickettsiaceae bacterium]|jgi:monothiol glutaredoxin|nr:monothiol glutaredoxin [Rickettsiaceae bacterium]